MKFTVVAIIKTDPSLLSKIKKLSKKEGLAKDNLMYLMSKKLEKPFSKYDISIDEKNENGKFDAWEAFDMMTTKELLNNLDSLDRFPYYVFTPERKWIEPNQAFMFVSPSNEKKYRKWTNTAKETLEKYIDNSIPLLIGCHS